MTALNHEQPSHDPTLLEIAPGVPLLDLSVPPAIDAALAAGTITTKDLQPNIAAHLRQTYPVEGLDVHSAEARWRRVNELAALIIQVNYPQ